MLLKVENLTFAYNPSGPPVLRGVNLSLEAGERVALIGANGCGKSTLLLHLNGLLRPSGGRILWQGQDVSARDFDRARWRRQVGFVFQQPLHQLFCESVASEVAFGLRQLRLSPEETAKRTSAALASVGLGDPSFYARSPFALSYGEQRRLALACALAVHPRLLALDEATAGLDAEGTRGVLEILRALSDNGISVIMATHDLSAAACWAGRVVVMAGGSIVRDGLPETVFRDTCLLQSLGLDPPPSYRLVDYLNRHHRTELARQVEGILLASSR